MKKTIAVIALAAVFAACNNNSKMSSETKVDSVKIIRDSLKLDSFQRADAEKKAALEAEEAAKTERAALAASSRSNNNTQVRGYSEEGYNAPQATQRKGMSSAAKGAIIGAGAGAVTGILVDKKNGRGAVIGGVVGAGTGYTIGRAKDRKTGRVQ